MKFKKILSAAAAFVVAAAAEMSINVYAEGLPATAYLCGAIGATSVWNADEATAGSTTAEINGDAQYQVEWIVSDGGTSKLEFLCVQIPGFTKDQYPDLNVTVDEVYVDENKLTDYQTSSKAVNLAYYEGGTGSTRLYLIDSWAGTGVADVSGDTEVTKSLKVKFTVSGTGTPGTSNVTEETTDDPIQDATDTTNTSDEADATEPATGGVEPTPTDEPEATEAPTTEEAVTTTVQTTAAQTTANNTSGGSTFGNQVSGSTSNAPGTKDAGIAAAFAGLAITAAIGVLTQLRKK